MRDITRGEAVCLFRRQWSDMQMAHGDCPDCETRDEYKDKWCETHGFSFVESNCFLCEWVTQKRGDCDCCPIDWSCDSKNPMGNYCMYGLVDFRYSPISEILALPESEVKSDTSTGR